MEKKLRFCLLCGHSFEPKNDSQVTCEHCFKVKSMDDIAPSYENTCVVCGKHYSSTSPFRLGFCPDCKYSKEPVNEELYRVCYLGQFHPVVNKYFSITEEEKTNRKTPIYHIISKHSNSEIGTIKWYGAWREFCFFPNEETIWDTNCLMELIKFINNLNEAYKECKKEYKHNIFKDNKSEHYYIGTEILEKGEDKND